MSNDPREDLKWLNEEIKKARSEGQRGEVLRLRKAKIRKQREIDETARLVKETR